MTRRSRHSNVPEKEGMTDQERAALKAVRRTIESAMADYWDELEAGGVRDSMGEVLRLIMIRLDEDKESDGG